MTRTRRKHFKHLHYPDQWKRYWSAYPEGFTILEALTQWVKQVNGMIDNVNDWNKYLDEFVKTYDKGVQDKVRTLMEKWKEDGTLKYVLEEAFIDDFAKKEWVNELLNEYAKRPKVRVTVGEGDDDFKTLNQAISYLRDMLVYPDHAEIVLSPSFKLKEQIIIEDKDLSFITITSEGIVPCERPENMKTITTRTGTGTQYTPFIYGYNSKMPTINAKFEYVDYFVDDVPRLCGYVLDKSEGIIKEGNGFTDFPWGGFILLNLSIGIAHNCDFSRNGNYDQVDPEFDDIQTAYEGKGVLVQNSVFSGNGSIANGCGDVGFHIQLSSVARLTNAKALGCGHHALVVTQSSIVTARNGEFKNTQDDNVVCESGARLDISGSDCSGAIHNNGIVAHKGGTIIFIDGIANNNGGWGIHAVNDGYINAEGATANGNGKSGISTGRLGRVYFRYGQANNNGQNGVNVQDMAYFSGNDAEFRGNGNDGISNTGAEVVARNATITENSRHGVSTTSGGKTTINKCTITNNNEYGILCENGEAFVRDSTVQGNGNVDIRLARASKLSGFNIKTTDTTKAMYVLSTSSFANVADSTGYVNVEPNTFTARGVVISNSLQQET